MKEFLKSFVRESPDFLELRYHRRLSTGVQVQSGRLEQAVRKETAGLGVRVLVDGAWGFSATTDLSRAGVSRAIDAARSNARLLSRLSSRRIRLAPARFATEDFIAPGVADLLGTPLGEKIRTVVDTEAAVRAKSGLISAASCGYSEMIEEKTIVHSDGACATYRIAIPEFRVFAIAERDGEQATCFRAASIRGGWNELLSHPRLEDAVAQAARGAVDLLTAPQPEGGLKTVILCPDLVGLIAHEAIGHTVEADLVDTGSVVQGAIGRKVASELVTLGDSGEQCRFGSSGAGAIPFDDEGVLATETVVIDRGVLVSYLHDRESAARYQAVPCGNARAWLYDDEPIIRMRNTWIAPGTQSLDELIDGVAEGYLAEGGGGGEADFNGEFMFGVDMLWEIRNGRKTRLCRGATLSGKAFEVLSSVDGLSSAFLWDMGSGHCGKGQPAKVDAGGPHLRCRVTVGGRQE